MSTTQQSIVAQWNEITLEAIREGSAKPTATTYQLHISSAAVYDAWAAFEPSAFGHYSEISTSLANTEENKAEALSFAAHAALSQLFPDQAATFDAFMVSLGYDPDSPSSDPDTASGLGILAAQNVFDARANDGSNAQNDFADTSGYVPINTAAPGSDGAPGGIDFDPNHWQPLRVPTGTVTDTNGVPIIDNNDPDSYSDQLALTPHWGSVDSFALASNSQFRPDAPPQLGDFSPYVDGTGAVTTNDQAYRDQIAEVMDISAGLSTEQKVIAEFWADGPRTESPPGHWNQIAQDIALREGHGIDEDAKLFFALNAAVFDAGIATWEAKYVYDYIRPQSAIRDLFYDQTIDAWGGVNQGTQQILAQQWQPYQNVTFVTPPFPEYVSGHSTFSMAAAKTIARFVGSDAYYDGTSLSNYDLDTVPGTDLLGRYETDELAFEDFGAGPPVVLQWDTLTEAAEEAGISRLYGGIHIQDGNLNGLEVGKQVAANAEIRWDALFTRGGDDDITTENSGGLTIAGSGDDTVSGGRGDDIVEAGSGDDFVTGGRGDDRLEGGIGDDYLHGGRFADTVLGGAGDDTMRGGREADVMLGGTGNDFIRGDHGEDLLEGGSDNDHLMGGRSNDVLKGDAGNDLLEGGREDDILLGGLGLDTLWGGDGDDILSGGDDSDQLRGGAGADAFVFYASESGLDIVADFNAVEDKIHLVGFDANDVITFFTAASDVAVNIGNTQVAVLNNVEADDLIVGDNILFNDPLLI